jgi:hypothetical protein
MDTDVDTSFNDIADLPPSCWDLRKPTNVPASRLLGLDLPAPGETCPWCDSNRTKFKVRVVAWVAGGIDDSTVRKFSV